jgi:hypothetical protein
VLEVADINSCNAFWKPLRVKIIMSKYSDSIVEFIDFVGQEGFVFFFIEFLKVLLIIVLVLIRVIRNRVVIGVGMTLILNIHV